MNSAVTTPLERLLAAQAVKDAAALPVLQLTPARPTSEWLTSAKLSVDGLDLITSTRAGLHQSALTLTLTQALELRDWLVAQTTHDVGIHA